MFAGLKFLDATQGLNGISALLAFACFWGIPIWRWTYCLWKKPVNTMGTSLLEEVHADWTKTIGFRGGRHLSHIIASGKQSKILIAKRRDLEIKKELLSRYEKMNILSNADLILSIKSLEEDLYPLRTLK